MLKKVSFTILFCAVLTAAYLTVKPHLIDVSDKLPEETADQQPALLEQATSTVAPASNATTSMEDKPASLPENPQISEKIEIPAATSTLAAASTSPAKNSQAKAVLLSVPFTPQAPFGDWKDQRQQDGCEEAAALMAYYWATGKTLSRDTALKEIISIADYEEKKYQNYHDTDVTDTIDRIFKGYFKYAKANAIYDIGKNDIIKSLDSGALVIVPTNGRSLGNPYYTPPGPDRHNLLIKGYDPDRDEFITNDPGTRRGEGYRYKTGTVINAIVDYPTGNHLPIVAERKAMIVVSK